MSDDKRLEMLLTRLRELDELDEIAEQDVPVWEESVRQTARRALEEEISALGQLMARRDACWGSRSGQADR